MDQEDKELLATAEKVVKGARGFLIVSTFSKNDDSEGGVVGNNVSQYYVFHTIAQAFGMSDLEAGMYLMKAGSMDPRELDSHIKKANKQKKAAAKKKAVKKVAKKKSK